MERIMATSIFDPQPATSVAHHDDSDRLDRTHDIHELLTVDDVAALLKVSRSWIYEHTRARGTPRSGRLGHVKVGKYVRFERQAVREFLSNHIRIT
jgi:excisionase family DNA binding protein